MKPATVGLVLVAAAGVAACGGSRAEHTTAGVTPTSTAIVVVPVSQPHTATQSTATAGPNPGPRRPGLHPAAASRTDSAGARRGATGGTRSRFAVRPVKSRHYVSGFAGQQCLVGSGLLNPLPVKGGWMAVDPDTHYPLYVDGPFKSRAAAGHAAKIRQPSDDVALTGVFVVWARAKSHLRAEVDTVAKCLKHGAGKSLTF